MKKFRISGSKWNLSPEKKFKEMIRLVKTGKRGKFDFKEEEAIEYLGNSKDKRATKPLIDVLKKTFSNRRKYLAVEALGKIGDESAIEPLIQALGKAGPMTHAVSEAIEAFGEPAIKFLVQAFNDVNDDVYQNVKSILKKFGEPSVDPLLKALEDEHPQVRMRAVTALGYIGDARAADPLHHVMLNDNDDNVKEEAAFALGKLKDKRAVDMLIGVTMHSFFNVQTKACKAMDLLGEIGDTSAVECLIQMLRVGNYRISAHAAESLGKIGDERAVSPLIEWIEKHEESHHKWLKEHPPDPDEHVSIQYAEDPFFGMETVRALIKIGKPAAEPLFQLLRDKQDEKSPFVNLFWMVKVLSKIGQPVVMPMLDALKSPDAKTGSLAAEVLRRSHWTEIEPFVRALGDDHEEEFCKVIRDVLQKDHAVDQLLNALSDESHHVRRNLVMVLGRIGDKKASDPLLQILRCETHTEVRKEAILALGHIGEERAIEPLIKILKSDEVSLMTAAEDAIGSIGKSAIKPLIQAQREGQIEPYRALNALSKIGKPAIEPLFQLMGKEYAEADILEALVKIGIPAIKPLIHAINHESVGRESGYGAIARIGEPAVEPLIELLADEKVGTNAVDALVKIGNAAVALLRNYLEKKSGSTVRDKIEVIIGMISN